MEPENPKKRTSSQSRRLKGAAVAVAAANILKKVASGDAAQGED